MSRLIPDSELLAAGDRAAAAKAAKPSARDDYPEPATWYKPDWDALRAAMCDEIDLLRAEIAELSECLQPSEKKSD